MIWNKIFKNLEVFSKDRKTREKVLIETFAKKMLIQIMQINGMYHF